jgi:hypothetical protein
VAGCIFLERRRKGDLFADIIEDRRCDPPLFVAVVQSRGSPEILFLDHFSSRSAASDAMMQFMSEYQSRRRAA